MIFLIYDGVNIFDYLNLCMRSTERISGQRGYCVHFMSSAVAFEVEPSSQNIMYIIHSMWL